MKLQLLCKFESSFIDSLKYRDVNSLKGRDVAKVDWGGGAADEGDDCHQDASRQTFKFGEKLVGGRVWLFHGHASELTSNVITEIIKVRYTF